MRHLPNLLTILRFILLPLFIYAVCNGERTLAVATLAVIAASDGLDGWIARTYRVATPFGALFDPVADKVVQVTALALLAAEVNPAFEPIPAWFLGVVVARDLLLLYGTLRIGRRHHKVVVQVRWEGRLSTSLVFLLLFGVLLGGDSNFVWAVVVVTTPVVCAAAIRYVLAGRKQFASRSPDP
ncbi:MAG: CDP-alcohol phosphatidyltransferase family protein [Planctomycetota bacterium]|jgi:cardiolipin synthase